MHPNQSGKIYSFVEFDRFPLRGDQCRVLLEGTQAQPVVEVHEAYLAVALQKEIG